MKVAIIGSGISGLYSAYLLKKNDITSDITIYEKNKVIGGRIKNTLFDTINVVDGAGVGRFKTDILLYKLCQELNVKTSKPYQTQVTYSPTVKPQFSQWDVVKFLKTKLKTLHRSQTTFKQFALEHLTLAIYNKFILYVGETDFENEDAIDVLNDYCFEFSTGMEAFSIDWNDFLNKIEVFLKGHIIKNKNITDIIANKDGTFIIDGKHYNKVIIATEISSTRKLLKNKIYDNISCQSFVRLYVKLDKPLNITTRLVITPKPFQKIIEMDRDRCVYMISYSDNKIADEWKNLLPYKINEIVERNILKLFHQNLKVVSESKLVYWECGTHYFKPLPLIYKNRDDYLEKAQNPKPNMYVVGEAFSRNQGWCEGALQSVDKIFGSLSNKMMKKSPHKKKSLHYEIKDGRQQQDKLQKLCDALCKAVIPESFFFQSKNEISGLFYNCKFDDMNIGNTGSVVSPIKYFSDKLMADTTVGFHTHPNDYNPLLFNENEVVDFPSGADIKADFFYPPINANGWFKNSIQAIVVPSIRHKQVGVFMYKPLYTNIPIDHLVVSGYYQIVKIINLDFDKNKAGELFKVMDSQKMNNYLQFLYNNKFNDATNDFKEIFYGPKNLDAGTSHWPWKKKNHFRINMFDFKTSKVNIKQIA